MKVFTFVFLVLALVAHTARAQFFGDKPAITAMDETNYFLVVMGDASSSYVRKTSPSNTVEILKALSNFPNGAGTELTYTGTGTPEGSLAARVGAMYRCTNTCTGSGLYTKTNGTGSTGWWLVQGGGAGGGGGDVTTSQLNTASNAIVAISVANTTTTSNALRTTFIAFDLTTSNGVIAALMTASNNLVSTIGSSAITTSNGVIATLTTVINTASNDVVTISVAGDNAARAAANVASNVVAGIAIAGDAATSNMLWSWSTAISNLVQTKQFGSAVLTNLGTLYINGSGSPEGSVSARVGALFLCTNGCTGAGGYIKTNGTGNTGWWLIQSGAGGGGGGAPTLTYVAVPVSGIVGGSQQGWVTNLTGDVNIIASNLTVDLHYYLDVHALGKVAYITNFQAMHFRGLGQGGASSFGTNGSSTLELWVDGVTGRTNAILSGPELSIRPDGNCLQFLTNALTRVITFTNTCTGTSGTLTNAGSTNLTMVTLLGNGGTATKTVSAGSNVSIDVTPTNITFNASASTLSGNLDTVTVTNRFRQLTSEITPSTDTNAIIDLSKSANVLLVLTTNAHLVFSNLVDGITGQLLVKQDTNGGRLILSARVHGGGQLITNGPPWAYATTNASDMAIWDFKVHYATNLIIYQRATYADLVAATNALHTGKQATNAVLGNIANTGAITNLESAGNTNSTALALIHNGTNTTGLIKTLTPGANFTITDTGTNLTLASTGGSSTFNFLPQAGSNFAAYTPGTYVWGEFLPNSSSAPIGLGIWGTPSTSGSFQSNVGASATNSTYGVLRATGSGTIQASIERSAMLFDPSNRIFFYVATLGFSNSPCSNVMHWGLGSAAFNFTSIGARLGWWAQNAGGTSATNWVAGYYNGSSFVNVYTNSAVSTDQLNRLGVACFDRSNVIWSVNSIPVATNLNAAASIGPVRPVIGTAVSVNTSGTNFLFYQRVSGVHEEYFVTNRF